MTETKTYVTIEQDGTDPAVYTLSTPEEIESARVALRDAGVESAVIYAGEPDGLGDSYRNGQTLFAAATYFAALSGASVLDSWSSLDAATLDGAKAEASKLLGDGFRDHTILVGVGMETVSGHAVRPLFARTMAGLWAEVSR